MAEQARAKRDDETDLPKDDPLAELANIMGMTDEQQLGIGADEIELELERELLGDAAQDDAVAEEPQALSAEQSDQTVEADASFEEQLTDELADVLAGMDDDEETSGEHVSEFTGAGQESYSGHEDEGEEHTAASEDPFSEIFNRPASDDTASNEPRDEDVFISMDESFESEAGADEQAVDPYAAEYKASLDEADDDDTDLESELEALLRSGEEESEAADDIEEDVAEDDFALAEETDTADTDFADITDEFAAALEPAELNEDGASDDAAAKAEDETSQGVVLPDIEEYRDSEADAADTEVIAGDEFELAEQRESGPVVSEAEVVAWDQIGVDEDVSADSDDVDHELSEVFGETDLAVGEETGEAEESVVAAEPSEHREEEISASQDMAEEGQDELDRHFDERVAALFGHATPQADIHEADTDIAGQSHETQAEAEYEPASDGQDSGADEDMVSEPLAAASVDNAAGVEERTGSHDTNLDALAALEKAVSELTGLGKAPGATGEPGDSGAPDIDTVAIEENMPPAQDDLGIPDLPEPEKIARPLVFDDIESEITAGFDGPAALAADDADDETDGDDLLKEFDAIFEDDLDLKDGAAAGAEDGGDLEDAAATAVAAAGAAQMHYDRWSDSGGDALPGSVPEKRSRRGPMMAALIGGVALIGAIGAFMYFGSGSGDNGTPAVIKADNQPVKVKPANPGGKTVPNQDNKVYQRVSGEQADAAPEQKTLVSKEEEPVDISKRAGAAAPAAGSEAAADGNAATPRPASSGETAVKAAEPAVPAGTAASADVAKAPDTGNAKDEIQQAIEASKKSEERLLPGVEPVETPAASSEDVAVLAPRRVRTMIVKPDGTLVERPEESPGTGGAETGTDQNATMVSPDSAKALEDAAKKLTDTVKQPETATAPPEVAAKAPEKAATTTNAYPVTPERAPIVPPRPAYQPVTVVGSTKETGNGAGTVSPPAQENTQIASAAAVTGYTVQIASQPSPEAAQKTSANLLRRYENVIGNRKIAIVPAEISGRGVYYRVRIQAESLADANDLCSRYKSAGGDCFVARP